MLPPGPTEPPAIQTLRWLLRPIAFLEACRRRYGDAFSVTFLGFQTPMVMISDPEAVQGLYSNRVHGLPPGRSLALEPILGKRSVLLLEGPEHLARRKLMLPPFHGERMRAYEATVRDVVERDVAAWPRGEPFPVHPRMQAITLEVIVRAVFGVSDEARRAQLEREDVRIRARGQRSQRAKGDDGDRAAVLRLREPEHRRHRHEEDQRRDEDRPPVPRRRQSDRRRGLGRSSLDHRNPHIAAPRDRLQVARRLGVVAEVMADLADGGVDPLFEVDVRLAAPQLLLDLLARDHLAGAADEEQQQARRLMGEAEDESGAAQLPGLGVELERSEAQHHRFTVRTAALRDGHASNNRW